MAEHNHHQIESAVIIKSYDNYYGRFRRNTKAAILRDRYGFATGRPPPPWVVTSTSQRHVIIKQQSIHLRDSLQSACCSHSVRPMLSFTTVVLELQHHNNQIQLWCWNFNTTITNIINQYNTITNTIQEVNTINDVIFVHASLSCGQWLLPGGRCPAVASVLLHSATPVNRHMSHVGDMKSCGSYESCGLYEVCTMRDASMFLLLLICVMRRRCHVQGVIDATPHHNYNDISNQQSAAALCRYVIHAGNAFLPLYDALPVCVTLRHLKPLLCAADVAEIALSAPPPAQSYFSFCSHIAREGAAPHPLRESPPFDASPPHITYYVHCSAFPGGDVVVMPLRCEK